jgi:hypothetical protein
LQAFQGRPPETMEGFCFVISITCPNRLNTRNDDDADIFFSDVSDKWPIKYMGAEIFYFTPTLHMYILHIRKKQRTLKPVNDPLNGQVSIVLKPSRGEIEWRQLVPLKTERR